MIVANWLVALAGMGLPFLFVLLAAYELATGKSWERRGPRSDLAGMRPGSLALTLFLIGSTFVLALIGAAVLTGALRVHA